MITRDSLTATNAPFFHWLIVFHGSPLLHWKKSSFYPLFLENEKTNISNDEYFEIHVLFPIFIYDPWKPNWAASYCSRRFSSLGWIWVGLIVPPVLQLLCCEAGGFHLAVSILGASPISLVRLTTDSPYLFLQLCCKNKITKPIKLHTAQLNTSQLCC